MSVEAVQPGVPLAQGAALSQAPEVLRPAVATTSTPSLSPPAEEASAVSRSWGPRIIVAGTLVLASATLAVPLRTMLFNGPTEQASTRVETRVRLIDANTGLVPSAWDEPPDRGEASAADDLQAGSSSVLASRDRSAPAVVAEADGAPGLTRATFASGHPALTNPVNALLAESEGPVSGSASPTGSEEPETTTATNRIRTAAIEAPASPALTQSDPEQALPRMQAQRSAPMSRVDGDWLLARAQGLITQGDISGARLLLEHALQAGNHRAAFLLAETYDPQILASWRALGLKGDPKRARELYARAAAGGIAASDERLRWLE